MQPTSPTFNDLLYEWMTRAPWLAISASAHALLILVLMAIPWELLRREQPIIIATALEQLPDTVFDEPPLEEVEVIEEPVVAEEPTLVDEDLPPSEAPADESLQLGEAGDVMSDVPFEAGFAGEIGIGDGWSTKYGERFPGGGRPGGGGGAGTARVVERGLEWLAAHQSPDGSWDSDGFSAQCGSLGAGSCDDPGQAAHDVGMTGLALLAFLGCGNTTRRGPHREVVQRGVKWLKERQDPDTGLLGEALGHSFVYDHAIATLALCEAYYFSKSPLLRSSAQEAVNWITRARNPYSAWRYGALPSGENDTSVTGWMVFALKAAEDAGLTVDPAAYAGALSWLDEVTDPATGRAGYQAVGTPSSRITGVNDHYPPERSEALTAVALLSRFFLGQEPDETPVMERQADLLLRALPEWDPDGLGCDMYAWYYGSYAMYQMGGSKHWRAWEHAMREAVVGSQREDGDRRGSWDPIGPWGWSGGRVYSTALMTLCGEVYYRYAQVTGAR